MRILLLTNYAPSLIPFRGELLRHLAEMGHDVTAAVPGPLGSLPGQLEARGVRCEELPFDRSGMSPLADLLLLKRLSRLLAKLRPELVLLYTIKPVLYGSLIAALHGVPRVICVIPGLGYAFGGSGLGRTLFSLIARLAYRAALGRAERVFFLNEDDASLFRSYDLVSHRRVVVIPGEGLDITHYQPPDGTPEPGTFLLIARLLRAKGIAEYAAAARQLRSRYPHARCYLLGPADPGPDGIPEKDLRRWVDEGSLTYLGEAADVRPIIARVGVLVLPSYREGLPRTVIEAMAMARAVITTDVPGCRQTVHDGRNGILIPPRDPIALANAMARLIDDPDLAKRMGQEGRRMCEQVYDVQVVNRRICDVIGLHAVDSGGIR